jgi:hypothetical protein
MKVKWSLLVEYSTTPEVSFSSLPPATLLPASHWTEAAIE